MVEGHKVPKIGTDFAKYCKATTMTKNPLAKRQNRNQSPIAVLGQRHHQYHQWPHLKGLHHCQLHYGTVGNRSGYWKSLHKSYLTAVEHREREQIQATGEYQQSSDTSEMEASQQNIRSPLSWQVRI